jgi:hypothetical protein
MSEGKMKMLFSLTRGTQNNVIEVPIDAQGHISIDPSSENGKLLFGMDAKGHAVFKGKFAEVAQSLGTKNGVEQMGILATHTGDGLGPIRDVIDIPAVDKTSTFLQVAEHSTKFMIPSDYEVDWPFVIPMAERRPMEKDAKLGAGYYLERPFVSDPYGSDPYGEDPYRELPYGEKPHLESNGVYVDNPEERERNSMKMQEDYLDRVYGKDRRELAELAKQSTPMSEGCRMSINLPAYREKNIYQTLKEYSVKQKDEKGEKLNPELFEINVLINRRNDGIPFDDKTIQEVERFKKEHPEYHVNMVKKTFNFGDRPVMGQIYKLMADLALHRNMERDDAKNKSRLIMRTGGADAMDKNSQFLSTVIGRFEDPNVAVYKSESRLPLEVIKKLPMLHVLYVMQSGLNRLWTRGKSNIGLGSFSAELYAKVGGFNAKVGMAEEVDLAQRMRMEMKNSAGQFELKRDLVKNAIDDPRRYIFALYNQIGMANAYNKFGRKDFESSLRNTDWTKKVLSEEIPDYLKLTKENLEREITPYYRQYLNQVLRADMSESTKERVRKGVNRIFSRMLFFVGFKKEDYEFNSGGISIKNISNLEKLIENRNFSSYENFE